MIPRGLLRTDHPRALGLLAALRIGGPRSGMARGDSCRRALLGVTALFVAFDSGVGPASDGARAETAIVRSGFAGPVDQAGVHATVRGSLGETWVGASEGGSLRIVSGFRPRTLGGTSLTLVLVAPNGDADYGTGNELQIRWELGEAGPVTIDLDWSSNQGTTWNEIARNLVQEGSGPGEYAWTTPRAGVEAAVVRVRASGAAASTLDESDASFAILDDDGPLLTLGLLANPYVERFVDLVAVADEPVDPDGLRFEVGGESVAPTALDDERRVFWLDTIVDGSVDSLAVRACALDMAGNEGCAEGALSVIRFADLGLRGVDAGGFAWSPDRRLGLAFEASRGGRNPQSVAILVTTQDAGPSGQSRNGKDALRYELQPEDAGPARLILPLSAEDLGVEGPRFTLHGADGPIELLIDREAGTARATIARLGPVVRSPGEPGPFRDLAELRTEIRSIVPNPVVTGTVIAFDVPTRSAVAFTVHDVAGRCVARILDNARTPPGRHEVVWDGARRAGGPALPAGTYWLRLRAGGRESQARIVLLGSGGAR